MDKHACELLQPEGMRSTMPALALRHDAARPTSKTTPRMFSSHMTPSLVAHWKAATHESLISFRYCTPLVTSVSRLGPAPMQTFRNVQKP